MNTDQKNADTHHARSIAWVVLFSLVISASLHAGEIFTWVDENGVTHFGDRPPQKSEASVVPLEDEPQTSGVGTGELASFDLEVNADGKTLAQQRREAISRSRETAGQDEEQLTAACDHHRTELARFEPARRITYTDENGEVVRLDDDQRMLLIDTTRNFLEKYCS